MLRHPDAEQPGPSGPSGNLDAVSPCGGDVREVNGSPVSEPTARRQTYRLGEAVRAIQQSPLEESRPVGEVPAKMLVSPDGAMVPLVGDSGPK